MTGGLVVLGVAVLWLVSQRGRWSVVLIDRGARPIQAIKALRELSGRGLFEAKRGLDTPGVLLEGASLQEARRWARSLQAAGARVHVSRERWVPCRERVSLGERGVLRRGGSFERLLRPGVHWVPAGARVERVALKHPLVERGLARQLAADPEARDELEVHDFEACERGVLWFEGRACAVLEPGRHTVWGALSARVERLRVGDDARLGQPQGQALLAAATPGQILCHTVALGELGYLYRDGVFLAELPPGRHLRWGGTGTYTLRCVEVRPHLVEAGRGLAVTTADRVEIELDLDLHLAADDPRWAAEAARDSTANLVRQAQVQLRAACGQRRVDALLADLGDLERCLLHALEGAAERSGWRVCELFVSVVGLAEVLVQAGEGVLEAEHRAHLERIRRREETAATRSRLNIARQVAACPTLLRLKELDAACALAAGGRTGACPAGLRSRTGGLRRAPSALRLKRPS